MMDVLERGQQAFVTASKRAKQSPAQDCGQGKFPLWFKIQKVNVKFKFEFNSSIDKDLL